MKKILPIIIAFVVFFSALPISVNAQTVASQSGTTTATCKVEDWECNSEVTFVGKLARRSLDTLDFVVGNYQWFKLYDQTKGDPLQVLWVYIRNVVYAIIGLFILAAGFIIIYTRGENITVRRFIPRFIAIIILVTLSYFIVQTLYVVTDIVQGFFLRLPTGDFISSKNLLSVSFNYQEFIGLRRIGEKYDEAATVSLILTKLTAASYFVMSAIMIIRKIILWFFILVSPVFPLLIFFSPLRNTAKIWVGEFFRWLLYAPLFAIFLRGIVEIWQRQIPQGFDFSAAQRGEVIYPTAINILLGGPSQTVTISNNLNLPDTFVQYVIALLMIWMVIIMPFILLRIFLSYFYGFNFSDNSLVKYLARGVPPKNSPPPSSKGPAIPPAFKHPPLPPTMPPSGDTGLARSIFEEVQKQVSEPVQQASQMNQSMQQNMQQNMQQSMNQSMQQAVRDGVSTNISSSVANVSSGQLIFSAPIQATPELQNAITQILDMTSLNIPTIRDISRYETAMLSKNPQQKEEVNKLTEAINKIAGKSQTAAAPGEQAKFSQIREKLVTESKKGNSVADSVLKAAGPVAAAALPEENTVQQVSTEDYEEVRKTWEQNYTNLEPPVDTENKPQTRKDWLTQEDKNITIVIQLLQSVDPQKQKEGMDKVSQILPFLLLGGFSRNEIITYLKAKLEAAKSVLNQTVQKQQDEDTMVDVDRKVEEKPKTMQMANEMSPEGGEGSSSNQPTDSTQPSDPNQRQY